MTRFLRPAALALLAAVALSACAKKAAESTRPETLSPGENDGYGPSADLDALEAQLAAREEQLRALGKTPPGAAIGAQTRDVPTAGEAGGDAMQAGGAAPEVAPAPTAAEMPAEKSNRRVRTDRCENVCELQAAICQLQDQICGLVPRHEGEPRYQRACERASADCSFATEACHGCA